MRRIMLCTVLVAAVILSPQVYSDAGITLYGSAELVTLPEGDVQLALDEFNEGGVADGIADHLFILQRPDLADDTHLSLTDAILSYAPGKLNLRFSPERELSWRLTPPLETDDSSSPADQLQEKNQQPEKHQLMLGAGIIHQWGNFDTSAWRLASVALLDDTDPLKIQPDGGGGIFCTSGGLGASSCSQTCGSTGNSCSVDCKTTDYACCNCNSSGVASCKCHVQPRGSNPPGGGS